MNKVFKSAVSLSAVFIALIIISFAFSSENAWAEDKPADKPHPCDSIKDRETEAVIVIRGQAEDANWGWSKVSDVIYSFHVMSKSEIVKVEKLRNGGRKVIEKRTFEKAEDKMLVTPVDVRLRLDTLPIDEVRQLLKIISVLFDFDGQIPEFPDIVNSSRSGDFNSDNQEDRDKLDKTAQIRELLKNVGKKYPSFGKFLTSKKIKDNAKVIEYLKKAFMGNTVLIKEFQGVRNLMFDKKNTFLVTWYFDENGDVTETKYRYEDGSLVTDEETRLILKRGNLLIDYCFERSNEEPIVDGSTGYLEASDIQYVFDPFVDGDYRGLIKFKANQQNNNEWKLTISNKTKPVRVEARNGSVTKTTGSLNLTKGSLTISNIAKQKNLEILDLKGAQLDASIEGKAKMNNLSRHHWLFKAKYNGEFIFDGEMSSKVIEKK